MKQLHLLIILAAAASFISGIGLAMFMSSSYTSNEPPNYVAVANQVDNNTFISQDNGTAFAAVNPNTNRIYLANEFSKTVAVVDGSSNAKIASIQLDSLPLKLAVNPDTNRIYVTEHRVVDNMEQNGTVTVIDGSSNAKIASIPVGVNPSGIAVNPDTNRIYVTNYIDGTVSVIDGDSNTVIGKPIQLDFGVEGIV
ncbi:MAG TPA: YncE family protein, partial [Nitrososphaera sp.]